MEQGDMIHERLGGSNFYFHGVKINKAYFYGVSEKESHSSKKEEVVDKSNLSDEKIAKAIESICGEGKPVDNKKKWVAVYWCLRWYCKFPANIFEFCNKMKEMPFNEELTPNCEYNNIRRYTMSFMDQDSRFLDNVQPSNMEVSYFQEFAPIVRALALELEK